MKIKRNYQPERKGMKIHNSNPDASPTLNRDEIDQVTQNDIDSYSPHLHQSLMILDSYLENLAEDIDSRVVNYIIENWPTLFDPDDPQALDEIIAFEYSIGKTFDGYTESSFIQFLNSEVIPLFN